MMKEDEMKINLSITVIISVMLIICVISCAFFHLKGYHQGTRDRENEAVKVGVAKWGSDENGQPKFEWIKASTE